MEKVDATAQTVVMIELRLIGADLLEPRLERTGWSGHGRDWLVVMVVWWW